MNTPTGTVSDAIRRVDESFLYAILAIPIPVYANLALAVLAMRRETRGRGKTNEGDDHEPRS